MKKVLIIDDEPVYRELASFYLKKAGYEVMSADTAVKGINLANEKVPDVVLMDLNLPDMNGLQAAHILKEEELTQDVFIVAYTAYITKEEQMKILDLYCDAVLLKPLHAKEVVEQVDKLLQNAYPAVPGYAEVHNGTYAIG